jgi:hypothetical protein
LELTRRAIRDTYATKAAVDAARKHQQLAVMLAKTGDAGGAARHLPAAAIIHVRMSKGLFAFARDYHVEASAWMIKLLIANSSPLIPIDYESLRADLTTELGVDLEDLLVSLDRCPMTLDSQSGDISVSMGGDEFGDSLSDVILANASPTPAEVIDPQQATKHFGELADFVAAFAGSVTRQLDRVLGLLGAAGWATLERALRMVIAGASKSAFADLDGVDAAVADMVISAVRAHHGEYPKHK